MIKWSLIDSIILLFQLLFWWRWKNINKLSIFSGWFWCVERWFPINMIVPYSRLCWRTPYRRVYSFTVFTVFVAAFDGLRTPILRILSSDDYWPTSILERLFFFVVCGANLLDGFLSGRTSCVLAPSLGENAMCAKCAMCLKLSPFTDRLVRPSSGSQCEFAFTTSDHSGLSLQIEGEWGRRRWFGWESGGRDHTVSLQVAVRLEPWIGCHAVHEHHSQWAILMNRSLVVPEPMTPS